jgi:hypothetical protein
MFCFNCGMKLIDNSKFCSSCGTAVQEVPQQLARPLQNGAPTYHQNLQHNNEIFNLLGYEVEIPKETEDYVSICNEFKQLAMEAYDRMSSNFDTKYRSLDDLVRHGDNDADELFCSALEHAIELLKRRGIYNINLSRFTEVASEYTGYWEGQFSEIREKFKELVEYKEAKKDYRSDRKAGRGRMIGGGFGVGGAVKGMAMAGTANLATGLLHSFTNALGNAATSAEVSSLKNKIFKDPDTKRTLCMSIYFDLHRAVVECINDSGLSLIAESYTSSEREDAYIIYNNIVNGSVSGEDLKRMIAEILVKDPFDMDYYELAMKHSLNEGDSDLIEYAHYFEMPIDELIQDLKAAIKNEERLAQLFGDSATELEHKLRNNSLYQAVKSELPEDATRAIKKAFFSIQNESVKSKVFLLLGDLSEKLATKMANVKASYAPIQAEMPILLFDNTAFGSAKDGFLITDKGIYVHNMMAKGWSYSFGEFEEMRLSGSEIDIDGKSADINLISGKDRGDFYEFVELVVFVQKYGGQIGADRESFDRSRASSEA